MPDVIGAQSFQQRMVKPLNLEYFSVRYRVQPKDANWTFLAKPTELAFIL